MIAPGYYSQECNVHKSCTDPTKYCHMFLCVDCLKENVACTQNGQCCPETECTYGRCKKGTKKGSAGNDQALSIIYSVHRAFHLKFCFTQSSLIEYFSIIRLSRYWHLRGEIFV